jgi:hypothetical protein
MDIRLRGKIQDIAKKASSAEEVGHLVCFLLEDKIGLAGNGWFDDDPEMQALFRDSWSEMDERVKNLVSH